MRIYGLNCDEIDDKDKFLGLVDVVKRLSPFSPLVRVVIDDGRDVSDYVRPVKILIANGGRVMPQICDSYEDKRLPPRRYAEKTMKLWNLFGAMPGVWGFEVGNEINGDWLSKEAWSKAMESHNYIKLRGGKTSLCFFLDGGMWDFIDRREKKTKKILHPTPVELIDLVTLSCYATNQRELVSMAATAASPEERSRLKLRMNAKDFAIGEYGTEEWKRAGRGVLLNMIRTFEPIGGAFLWSIQDNLDVVGEIETAWGRPVE